MNFTEDAYRDMLKYILTQGYRFIGYQSVGCQGDTVVLRHDIDMSPHRAAKIAKIECEQGIRSTYFLHLHSAFYNLFEGSVVDRINVIIDCGHDIGLHYDPEFYQNLLYHNSEPFGMIQEEKVMIWDIFGVRPDTISFHNPSLSTVSLPKEEWIQNMFNVNCDYMYRNYTYCSDSNGMWNSDPCELIAKGHPQKLHILTHPGWWLPPYGEKPKFDGARPDIPPIEKVARCIDGRSEHMRVYYNNILSRIGKQK